MLMRNLSTFATLLAEWKGIDNLEYIWPEMVTMKA